MRPFKSVDGLTYLVIALMLLSLWGCGKTKDSTIVSNQNTTNIDSSEVQDEASQQEQIEEESSNNEELVQKESDQENSEDGVELEDEVVSEDEAVLEDEVVLEDETPIPFVVVIDAGHQGKGNSEKEPIGPGALETKPKVASGTQGVRTKTPEYVVNLEVSLKLQKLLEEKGYQVIMIRETHDVDISNSQRAAIANEVKADAFVRIHCNGSDNKSIAGALTMCQTKNNPYCGELYEESHTLSRYVVDELCKATGAKNRGIIETDTMSGINWCEVPVTIVEMGYMTNSDEDELLCNNEYQIKLAEGIANGIESYLNNK